MRDPYEWLEDVDGERALAWVGARNAETPAPPPDLVAGVRAILDDRRRVPRPTWHGGHLYNLWQDADHPRGLWRRTTVDGYALDDPPWEVLLDLDALGAAEGESWVWGGATHRRPAYDRCLVELSRGGSDAAVVREFDLAARAFVDDGSGAAFTLAEAKSDVSWIDADTVYVSTELDGGGLTASGYPRTVRRWRRGTPLADAEQVYECGIGDVSVRAWHDPTPGYERGFVGHYRDFYTRPTFLVDADGSLRKLDLPEDADWSARREWLLVKPREAWTVGGVTHPAGALLVTRFDDFMAGDRSFTTLYTPDERSALVLWRWTRDHLLLVTLEDVRSRLTLLVPGEWAPRPASAGPAGPLDTVFVTATEPDLGDTALLSSIGFLRPETLSIGERVLKRAPAFFDSGGMTVEQRFATSDDGTRVPYFLVGHPDATGPAWLTAYGGFEVPSLPSYDGVVGRFWLERGGRYAVAHIRGGGEYGPRWHLAARREKRPRAFEDFAAVARDLADSGVAPPGRIGVSGGSNGGLLMGAMLTRYPELVGAVVAIAPLLDLRRFHTLLAGASWIGEYGDPDDERDWAYLRTFSPYHSLRPDRRHPPVLFLTSTRDDRVHPGHARKMLALLREHGQEGWLYENVEGGHGAAADNAQRAYMLALEIDFFRRHLDP
ncbi:prolyl oligopeptidase family serine peptidase [Virgisporangium ochraceum]